MPLMIKICGLTDDAAVAAAVTAGADALGFVFAASPRQVTPAAAARLCREVPEGTVRVAVMQHPDAETWRRVWHEFRPHWLQTDAEDLQHLDVPPGCELLPVYRDAALQRQELPASWPPRLLFEGSASGAGRQADWALAAEIARRTRLVLAGGLHVDNVTTAIDRVRPWGVDVSSGVEAAPGQKDPARIEQFIARARAAEERA